MCASDLPTSDNLYAGMGQYKAIRQALDYLVEEDALEIMLQKAAPVGLDSQGKAGSILPLQICCALFIFPQNTLALFIKPGLLQRLK